MSRLSRICPIAITLLAALSSPSHADLTFTATLNTTPLESDAAQGPFYVDLTLTGGSTLNTAQVTINGFTFGSGGSAGSSINPTNGASGNINSTVTLVNSTEYNDFYQSFTPGSQLTFNVDVATTSYDTPIPANFSFSILDGTQNPIPTTDPTGADTLLNVDLNGPSPTFNLYGSVPDSYGLSAPTVSTPSMVPEPATLVMVSLGLLMAGSVARRRRRPG